MIIDHNNQPLQRGYYSKILNRAIVTLAHGLAHCTIWDQIVPTTGYIVPHYHTYDEVLTCIEGSVEVTIGDITSSVHAPCSVVVYAGKVHAVMNRSTHDARLTAYHATATPKNHYPDGVPPPVVWEND